MKKKAIVLLAFTAALTAVSCQKEAMKEAETTPTGEGMTISAVSEGIGAEAKAAMVYKYDVVWKTGDKICVKNSEKSVGFTLTGGEETTKGTFSSGESISGDVEGFYPSSIVTDGGLVWPAEQGSKQICPMYCKKNLSSTQNQTFNFASLGSVLQLNFNSTTAGIVLKSIEVKADEAMSGAFTINEEGKAVISQPEGDKPGITLDLGEGVTLGTSAKKFNIAVPAGEYHGLSIVFTATDGKKCTINAKKDKAIEMVFNTVNTLAVSGEFKGVFTVSNDNGTTKTQIYFSQGNLYAKNEGTTESPDWKWHFYDEQYQCNSLNSFCDEEGNRMADQDETEIDLFTWGYSASTSLNPTGDSYVKDHTTDGDKLVYDKASSKGGDDWGVAYCESNNITVGTWRTLSTAEWQYLFNTREVNGGTGEGKSYQRAKINSDATSVRGMILYPDNYTSQTDATSYTSEEWTTMEENGCVFLPRAGRRLDSDVYDVGGRGVYWSSTALDESSAYLVYFDSEDFYSDDDADRSPAFSVRLITECQ